MIILFTFCVCVRDFMIVMFSFQTYFQLGKYKS